MMTAHKVVLSATPSVSLMDDVVHVTATGLLPGQSVTITAMVLDETKAFIAHAFYIADQSGNVDLDRAPSVGGSYRNVEPMGLFWSLRPSSELRENTRIIKADVSKPFLYDIYIFDGHLPILNKTDVIDLQSKCEVCLANVTLRRYYQSLDVTAVPVRSGKVRGMLFLPRGECPFPGVIDLFGGSGGLIKIRAALLASRGFAALALAYFNFEDLPDKMELHLEYFEEAIDFMTSHPSVTRGGIGVVGVCKGANIAMEMALLSSQVKAVVAINPFFYHEHGMLYHGGVEQNVWECMAIERDRCHKIFHVTKDGSIRLRGSIRTMAEYKDDAAIPVERARAAEFLFISGEDDENVDQLNLCYIVQRFDKYKKSNYRVLSYPGAGHLIEPPYTPLCRESFFKPFNVKFLWGGQPKLHSVAQERSWREILAFLREKLNSSSNVESQETEITFQATIPSKL